ncbi:MAG: YihY/virulence factor BrkB family protein [Candidatus Limnocylindrales bacterium]
MAKPGLHPPTGSDPGGTRTRYREETHDVLARIDQLLARVLGLPPTRRSLAVLAVYNEAGGSLLAEGLAYSALFAGLTGLLFAVGVLGYLVPAPSDRQRLVDGFTGQLAPLAPVAQDALANVAAHAGAFSIVGLAGAAWAASHFYGALDQAIARVFSCAPARGAFDRILRGFVSILLLVGGLLSGIAISGVQALLASRIDVGRAGDAARTLSQLASPLVTAVVVVIAVGVVYRVVPNTPVPLAVLRVPALVAGMVLTGLTELLVYITPFLTGALSVFGGVAAVFAGLAWLHLAFQVLLVGASWTRVRLNETGAPGQQPDCLD